MSIGTSSLSLELLLSTGFVSFAFALSEFSKAKAASVVLSTVTSLTTSASASVSASLDVTDTSTSFYASSKLSVLIFSVSCSVLKLKSFATSVKRFEAKSVTSLTLS